MRGLGRLSLGGVDGGVTHKLGVDISNNNLKWTLRFEPPSSSPTGSPSRGGGGGGTDGGGVGPVLLRSSGSAMTVCGRVRHVKSGKEKGFSVTMDHAKTLSLDATDLSTDRSSVPADLFEQTSPVGFWRLVVTGSGFADAGVPQIGSLRLEAICADKPTKATCNIPGNAVLVRGSVVFAPSAGKALEEELFIDQITLLSADVYLPGEAAVIRDGNGGGPGNSSSSSNNNSGGSSSNNGGGNSSNSNNSSSNSSNSSSSSSSSSNSATSASTTPIPSSIGSPQGPRDSKYQRIPCRSLTHQNCNNVLPVGSHRQRIRSIFSWLLSVRVLLVFFSVFLTWGASYTGAISRTLAGYVLLAVITAAFVALAAIRLVNWYRRKPVLNARSFLVNSYNAWGYCGTIAQGESLPLYAMPSVLVRAFHDGSPSLDINLGKHQRSSYVSLASDMFSVLADRNSRTGLVVGFLSQQEQFGCIAVNDSYEYLSVRCACDGVTIPPSSCPAPMVTDWLFLQAVTSIDEAANGPLDSYMVTSGRFNSARVRMFMPSGMRMRETPPSGWCSWYHFFSNIHEENLVSNVDSMVEVIKKNGFGARHGFDLFQVDDGYQRAWGDWLTLDRKKFPKLSLTSIVGLAKSKGLLPGVWMAPFAADKHSTLARQHPSWLLRQDGSGRGKPCNSANCGKWFYGLDVTNPEVQAHIRDTISTMTGEWGFQYLKLDFLYSAVLADAQSSYHDRTLTRAQAMQMAMHAVTQSAGPYVYLLGCGAPMGSVIGHVHANRVSADAGLSWLPEFPLPSTDKWNLPSARSMLRNTLCRMPMHGRWWINDPDCMLLRRSTSFTDEEIVGIATVKAMSGGSFILSDDLASVAEDRMRVAHQLLPATNQAAVAVDLLDSETPELLRLVLPAGAGAGGSLMDSWEGRGHGELVARLAPWALFAVCNWAGGDGDDGAAGCGKTHMVHLSTALGQGLYDELQSVDELGGGQESDKGGKSGGVFGPVLIHLFDFWTMEYSYVVLGDSGRIADNAHQALLHFPPVAAHSARLFAMRVMLDSTLPMYIGSNLHFSCGLEVASFRVVRVLLEGEGEGDGSGGGEGASPPVADSSPAPPANPTAVAVPMVSRAWTCSVVFAEGAVRDAAWKGFAWIYLPVESSDPSLRLVGNAVSSGSTQKSKLQPVASIVLPISGRKGTVFKVALGRRERGADDSPDSVEITWVDRVSAQEAEGQGGVGGKVIFRS